jgi:hypothetical protein
LWDFYEHKEEIPELVTVLEAPLKIEQCKVNKQAEITGEHKGVYYYIISSKDEFKVYHARLELLLEGDIDNKMDRITSIEFGLDTKYFFVGTEKGLIHKYELPSPQEVADDYQRGKNGEAPRAKMLNFQDADGKDIENRPEKDKTKDYAITNLYKVRGILEIDFFVLYVRYSGLFVWDEDMDKFTKVNCGDIDASVYEAG